MKLQKKDLIKDAIQKEALAAKVTKKERKIFDLVSSDVKMSDVHKKNPYIVLKYYQNDWQCFSDWEKAELKQWTAFLSYLAQHTWQDVYETASGKPKHGLAYTKYDVEDVKSTKAKGILQKLTRHLSEDIDFFELRVDQKKLRVHGFQTQAAFFLVLLDREHEIFP